MRKLVVLAAVTLDGVVQSPGGADEDPADDFVHGGWANPYRHADITAGVGTIVAGADALLLGRRTYDIYAETVRATPFGDRLTGALNTLPMYVASRTLGTPTRHNTIVVRHDVAATVERVKTEPGDGILTVGSRQLVRTLLAHHLVDELQLLVYPLTIGRGKQLSLGDLSHTFSLQAVASYFNGVVGLGYVRRPT